MKMSHFFISVLYAHLLEIIVEQHVNLFIALIFADEAFLKELKALNEVLKQVSSTIFPIMQK